MIQTKLKIALTLSVCTMAAFLAQAQQAATPSAPSPAEEWIQKTKNPVSWLTWGADLRIRDEFHNNANMGSNPNAVENNYLRFRTRVWTSLTPFEDLSINARMTWEQRYYMRPRDKSTVGGDLTASGRYPINAYELDEAVLDNLNIRLTNILSQPLCLTLGRQDMKFGDGWLVLDGTPRDGSRTFYFDAARLTLNCEPIKTLFDVVYIDQAASFDRFFLPINHQGYREFQMEQDERGVILYAVNKSVPNTQLDGYFMFKQDREVDAYDPAGVQRFGSIARNVFTFGGRASVNMGTHWNARGEVAQQLGTRGSAQQIQAIGANSQLSYSFLDDLKNSLRVGYEFLSGDDSNTAGRYERFDVLWGRWPRFSELLVYNPTFGQRGTSEWGNIHRPFVGWTVYPMKKLSFNAEYAPIFADTQEFVFGKKATGSFRGHLLTGVMEYTHNKHLKAHIRPEIFLPGNYYSDIGVTKAMETFIRGEILMTW